MRVIVDLPDELVRELDAMRDRIAPEGAIVSRASVIRALLWESLRRRTDREKVTDPDRGGSMP